jgi:hypothetical protein
MSRAQFRAALARRGWRCVLGAWIDLGTGTSVGMILQRKTPRSAWKTNYRASLAKAIREMERVS